MNKKLTMGLIIPMVLITGRLYAKAPQEQTNQQESSKKIGITKERIQTAATLLHNIAQAHSTLLYQRYLYWNDWPGITTNTTEETFIRENYPPLQQTQEILTLLANVSDPLLEKTFEKIYALLSESRNCMLSHRAIFPIPASNYSYLAAHIVSDEQGNARHIFSGQALKKSEALAIDLIARHIDPLLYALIKEICHNN